MTCMYQEYQIKIKMVQQLWSQLGSEHWNCYVVGRHKNLGGGGGGDSTGAETCPSGRGINKFSAGG